MSIGPVAKHATGPILFAIAAISPRPYLLSNDKRLSKQHWPGGSLLLSPPPPDNFYGLHALRGGRIVLGPELVLHFVHHKLRLLWITQKMAL